LSLDLSYNEVGSLEELRDCLRRRLSGLRQLCLAGSPVCLLPFYRLRAVQCALPNQLEVLDGVALTEEEAASRDEEPAPLEPRPPLIRIALELKQFSGVRCLLSPVAEAVEKREAEKAKKEREEAERKEKEMREKGELPEEPALPPPEPAPVPAAKAAAGKTKASPEPEEPPVEEKEPILKTCAGGTLRLRFQLPDGDWRETAAIPLKEPPPPEPVPAKGKAAAVVEPVPVEPAFDSFDLSKLQSASGDPLCFELPMPEATLSEEDAFFRLCRWIRDGMALRSSSRLLCPRCRVKRRSLLRSLLCPPRQLASLARRIRQRRKRGARVQSPRMPREPKAMKGTQRRRRRRSHRQKSRWVAPWWH
jgi:hypothetical protein